MVLEGIIVRLSTSDKRNIDISKSLDVTIYESKSTWLFELIDQKSVYL